MCDNDDDAYDVDVDDDGGQMGDYDDYDDYNYDYDDDGDKC